MKKMLIGPIPFKRNKIQKTWLIMRLTIFLTLILVLRVSASVYSQQTRLSLKLDDVSLEQAFAIIHEQTDYDFFYKTDQIPVDRRVSAEYKNLQVEVILEKILQGTNLSFYVLDKDIVISPKREAGGVLSQQTVTLTGKVTDSSGEPLPGVTVVIKGTTIGTITDFDGNYNLSNVTADATIVFSFVGMRTVEEEVDGQTVINISLEEESIGIEEVVAIGYGSVKKSDLTGAVGSVQGEAIASRQSTQISQALQGAMSGVMVTRNNNAPGSTATIRIRGITSIGESNPLVIVDGVPVGGINDVNPNDVESISVLKDAASASIYGSRAAAGVILVTTKRAKSGELNFDYNVTYGFEKPTAMPDYVDVTRYMQMTNELRWNDNGNNDNEYPTYTKDVVDNYHALNAENPDLYPITDWVDLILKDSAPRQSHVLSITAGTKAIRTKASIAYDKTDALYDGRSYERITARFNNDITVNKYLSATADAFFKRSITNLASIDPMYYMLISAPVYAAEWSDGRVAEGKTGANIYGQLKNGGYENRWYNQVGGKLSIDLTPFSGFKLSAIVAPTLNFDKAKNFRKKVPYYAWDDPTVFGGYLQWGSETSLQETRDDSYSVTSQLIGSYIKAYGEHSLNLMAGYENFYAFDENLGASRGQYVLDSYPYLNLGPLEFRDNSGSASENAYRSYFGRFMYNYGNRYFLQANIRYDGSSRFHKDYRWGSFPSFSAGWVVSEESFMNNLGVLSYLKLRGSWGSLGNERIGNYPYQATIAFADALFYQGSNVTSAQTAAQTRYAISDISWETTESIDIGVDAGFFENKLRITADYYKKTTKDMLLALEIPDYIGFDNPDQNTGKMNTEGWELEVGWNDRLGDLGYSVSANLSDFKSVMGDLGGTEFLGSQIKKEGSEFNEWYGYVSDGLFQTQEEVDASPKLNSSVKPGDIKYVDISGPEGVPDGIISPEYDRTLLGGSLPRYMFGANIMLDYKNFDFSMVFQGIGKQNSRLSGLMVTPLMENWGHIPAILDGDYWSKYNSDEQNQNVNYPRLSRTSEGNNFTMSDYWLIDGGYVRLKNITLGYSIPGRLLQKVDIQSIRVYASVSDFLTIDNYPRGWDPEVSSSGYPITASYIFGLAVKF